MRTKVTHEYVRDCFGPAYESWFDPEHQDPELGYDLEQTVFWLDGTKLWAWCQEPAGIGQGAPEYSWDGKAWEEDVYYGG